MNPVELLHKNLQNSINAKQQLLKSASELAVFHEAVKSVLECYHSGGRLYIAGNGGSAADAQHLAAEFVSKLGKDRSPLAAEALTVDSSVLTAIGNDYGYDEVFSRQVEGKMSKKDIFLGITTSGGSINILNALEQCKKMKIQTIIFTGQNESLAKEKADYCIAVPGERTSTIQEVHIVLAHTLCEAVEQAIFKS